MNDHFQVHKFNTEPKWQKNLLVPPEVEVINLEILTVSLIEVL